MKYFWIVLLGLLLVACQQSEDDAPRSTSSPNQQTQVAAVGGALKIGGTVRDALSDDIPSRSWSLTARQGDTIVIQLSRVSGSAKFSLQLLSPQGNILTELNTQASDYAVSIPFILPTAGEYNLVVSRIVPNTEGVYALSIENRTQSTTRGDTTPTPTFTFTPTFTHTPITPTLTGTPTETVTPEPPTIAPAAAQLQIPTSTPAPTTSTIAPPPGGRLEIGETRTGEITQPGEIHRFTFFGGAEEVVSIGMNLDPAQAGTLNPYLELQAPNGSIVAQNDSFLPNVLDALIGQFELPATGVYTLYAKSRDGAGTGRYLISVSDGFTLRDVERGVAAENLPNEQSLETLGQRDVWTIMVQEGDLVSVAVEVVDRTSGFNVMAELVAPNGESWFDDDGGAENDAFLDKIEAPITGEYVIHIAANNNASTGAYRLWWQIYAVPTPAPPTIEPPPAPSPTPIIGTVGEARTSTYPIQVNEGQTVNILVTGIEGFDAILRVYAPIGNIIVDVDDVGTSVDPAGFFVAATSGLYTIEISGFEGASGSFTLSYDIQ